MTRQSTPPIPAFEELRVKGLEAHQKGQISEALEFFGQAWEAAKREGSPTDIDLAFCNRSTALIGLGRPEGLSSELHKILLKNSDPTNCRLAAYHLARCYELRQDYKKGLFYGRIALKHSIEIGRVDWISSAHNQLGNLLVADSYFAEAGREYQQALDGLSDRPTVGRALILDNLGYCQSAQGHSRLGIGLILQGLRILRAMGAREHYLYPYQDLCFSYLELGRYDRALHHGRRSLGIAEESGNAEAIKNSLYLLGEAANLAGEADHAFEVFSRLQSKFYPDSDFLPQFLLAFDVRQLINLRA